MSYIDTHTHLPDECLDEEAEQIFREAAEAGVTRLILAGTGAEDCPRYLRLAETHPGLYATVGFHPENSADGTQENFARLREWARHPRAVAVGEVGLDAHWEGSSAAEQEALFEASLRLAAECGKPLMLHCREAFERCHALIVRLLPAGHPVHVHCFADGPRELDAWLKLNTVFSYNGMVTFKKADNIRETLRLVPDERLLLETDAPYLAPTPYCGKPNSSKYIPLIAARIAEERGTTAEAIGELTTANAVRFYGLEPQLP